MSSLSVLNFEICKILFCAEPLKDFILYMPGGGLGNASSSDSSSATGMHVPWLQELTKRFLVLSLSSPFSMAEGPRAESKPHSSPSTIALVFSLHFNLKSTCFSDLPAWQDQLFEGSFLNPNLSCLVLDFPDIT